MFIPIGDEPNPRQRPVVTYALIAANVAVFLFISLPLMGQRVDPQDPELLEYLRYLSAQIPRASMRELLIQVSAYDLFTFKHGFRPAEPSVADLFKSMFLHGGWLHLGGNMLFLWIFGDNVEGRLGRVGFALVYLLAGVAATLFFAATQLGSHTPLVGASGAISGVLGCYFVWFPKNRVRMLVVLFWFIDVWRIPARLVLGMYLVIDNLLPFLLAGEATGVAYGAHIGGFIGGVGVAYLHASWAAKRRRFNLGGARPPAYESREARFGRAVQDARWDQAADHYARMSLGERGELDDADVLALADGLVEEGRPEAALAVLQRFIATRPRSAFLPAAHLQAGMIQLTQLGRPAAAREHFLTVLDFDPEPALAQAAHEGLTAAERLLAR